jgi:xanthine dehydrogenase small subunit
MICFLLNDQPVELDNVAPELSVLQYLRGCLGMTGTKEGCAAGDCGACTVVLGELSGTGIEYQTVNACITPVGALHGRQLLTVEHLALRSVLHPEQNDLHPVQSAMVECHGSQCGFCTPGVVMSLFSWWHAAKTGRGNSDRQSLEVALSGNLCRCTGYQPIFRAAEQSLSAGLEAGDPGIQMALTALQSGGDGTTSKGQAHFFAPTNSTELVNLLSQWPQAQLVAGATDLGLEFTQLLKTPQVLIDTGRVRELLEIRETPDALLLGGAVTYSRAQPYLAALLPAFALLLERLGSLQIRNRGTFGGNVANASPIGDTPPVLLALGARVHLRGSSGVRVLSLDQFFTGYRTTALRPGEFIETLELPKLGDSDQLKVYKISKRFDDDISAVCLALWLRMDQGVVSDVRLGCGGMAATPARAPQVEQALRGRPLDTAAIESAKGALALDFQPIDDVRASAAYRLAVAGNLLTRAFLEIQGGEPLSMRGGQHA